MSRSERSPFLYPPGSPTKWAGLAACIVRLAAIPFLDFSRGATIEYGRIARAMLSGFGFSYPWTMANGTTKWA